MYSMSITGRSFSCLSVGVICSYFILPDKNASILLAGNLLNLSKDKG